MRKFFASFLEVVEIALIAVGAVFVVRTFLVQPFLVSGASMVPNFANGDYVLVDELSYRLHPPQRGDVVVFHDPQDWSTYFIKRVVGLPGERVAISNNAITVANSANPRGVALHESYLPARTSVNPESCNGGTFDRGVCTYAISPTAYLVLGDNRGESYDSRAWGPLPAKNIVGLVRIRLWPLTEITAFAAPKY